MLIVSPFTGHDDLEMKHWSRDRCVDSELAHVDLFSFCIECLNLKPVVSNTNTWPAGRNWPVKESNSAGQDDFGKEQNVKEHVQLHFSTDVLLLILSTGGHTRTLGKWRNLMNISFAKQSVEFTTVKWTPPSPPPCYTVLN